MTQNELDAIVRAAFAEDLPDITSESIFAPGDRGSARFLVKGVGVIAGLAVVETVFQMLDASATVELLVEDGARVKPGDIVAT
jgi:nicotinate-nucleotide pyrophosphorylase (carboxylating)